MEIKELMGYEYVKYINDLNNYIEKTNKKYKSHYETLKAWWFKNQKAKASKKKMEETPQFLEDDYNWLEDNIEDEETYLGTPIDDWLKDIENFSNKD